MPRYVHTLRDGSLEFTDRGELRLTLARDRRRASSVALPRPSSGYGGHELVVSRDERLAALFLYSGQSEVGFELFELGAKLRPIFSLPYVLGDADPPRFSADATWLVMLVRTHGGFGWYDDSDNLFDHADPPPAEDRATGDRRVWRLPWAELHVVHVPTRTPSQAAITIETDAPPTSAVLHATWSTHDRLVAVDAEAAELLLPWGETLRISLPPGAWLTATCASLA
jgi:hypothetical protein